VKKWRKPFEALVKNGGGDGSRTHVRNPLNIKYYMLSLCLYYLQHCKGTDYCKRQLSVHPDYTIMNSYQEVLSDLFELV